MMLGMQLWRASVALQLGRVEVVALQHGRAPVAVQLGRVKLERKLGRAPVASGTGPRGSDVQKYTLALSAVMLLEK